MMNHRQGTSEQEQASGPISFQALPELIAPAFSWPAASCLSGFSAASLDFIWLARATRWQRTPRNRNVTISCAKKYVQESQNSKHISTLEKKKKTIWTRKPNQVLHVANQTAGLLHEMTETSHVCVHALETKLRPKLLPLWKTEHHTGSWLFNHHLKPLYSPQGTNANSLRI